MNRWLPGKSSLFIKILRKLSFEGPYSGIKHQFMIYEHHRLTIPSNLEYSIPQLKMMLKQVESIIGITIRTQDLITYETKPDRFLKPVRFERSSSGSYKILSPYT